EGGRSHRKRLRTLCMSLRPALCRGIPGRRERPPKESTGLERQTNQTSEFGSLRISLDDLHELRIARCQPEAVAAGHRAVVTKYPLRPNLGLESYLIGPPAR